MANNGLKADNYSGWIDKSITIDKELNRIISNYVIGTPGFDCSSKGRDLYSFYGIQTGEGFKQLLSELLNGHEVIHCEDYESVRLALLSDPRKCFSNELPQNVEEWLCYYIEKPSEGKFYQALLPELQGQGDSTWSAEDKKAIVKVEMLFRHIRNSFAHGLFTFVSKKNERFYILQDENKQHYISARMIIKHSTLKRWTEILDDKRVQFVREHNN